MQDLYILGLKSFFFLSTPLGVLKQGISSSISFALLIIDLEVILWQFLSLVDLSIVQVLYIYEALEVVVVCKYENFILPAF